MKSKVKKSKPNKSKRRELDAKEIAKGRSPWYYEMSNEDQWAEDKRLGILDWDGK